MPFDEKLSIIGLITDALHQDFRAWDEAEEGEKDAIAASAGAHLEHAFDFMNRTFGKGQEMVLFLTELSGGYHSLKFIRKNGSEAYYEFSKMLLLKDRAEELRLELNNTEERF